jgi:hypothetical protein
VACVTNATRERLPGDEPERGFLLAVLDRSTDAEEELGELRELARAALVEPVDELVQQRSRPDTRSYVGKGKLEELKSAYKASRADVLVVDDELSPTQQRTLENALTARVVDRTQLILDIFAQHAVSAEGKLQVELAQLDYNLPRMRGMWQHLERLGAAEAPSAAASARAAPASPSSRATAEWPGAASSSCGAGSRSSAASARRAAVSVSGRKCRPSRWPATRMWASRAC